MLKLIVKFVKGEKIKRFEAEVKDVVIALKLRGVRLTIPRQVLCVSVPFQNNTHFHHIQFWLLWMESTAVWAQTMLVALNGEGDFF